MQVATQSGARNGVVTKDGKILERLPLAGSSDGATFNPTMEGFSTQGIGTMIIVKGQTPPSADGRGAGRGAAIPGSFTIISVGR
jgi:hypothetical protein